MTERADIPTDFNGFKRCDILLPNENRAYVDENALWSMCDISQRAF